LLLAAGVKAISVDVVTTSSRFGVRGKLLARDLLDELVMTMTDQVTGAKTSASSTIWVIPDAAMRFNNLGGAQRLVVPPGPGSIPPPKVPGNSTIELDLGGDINGNITGPMGTVGPTASLTWTWSGSATYSATPVTVTAPPSYAAYVASSLPKVGRSGTLPAGTIPRAGAIAVTASVASVVTTSARTGSLYLPGVWVELWTPPISVGGILFAPNGTLLDSTLYPKTTPPPDAFADVFLSVPTPATPPTLTDPAPSLAIKGVRFSASGPRNVYYYDVQQGLSSATVLVTPL
jgi:hypothetical protein